MSSPVRVEVIIRIEGAEHKVQAPAPLSIPPVEPMAQVPTQAPQVWVDSLPQQKLSDSVREIVISRLAKNQGNRTHAARELGISLRGLRNMIKEFEAAGFAVPVPKYLGFELAHAAREASGYADTDKGEDDE